MMIHVLLKLLLLWTMYENSYQCRKACLDCRNETLCYGCKDGYFLYSRRCHKCNDGCLMCAVTNNNCSSCRPGRWGDWCQYSCIPCEDCIQEYCKSICRDAEPSQCSGRQCPHKCTLNFSGDRKNHSDGPILFTSKPTRPSSPITKQPPTSTSTTKTSKVRVIAVVSVLVLAVIAITVFIVYIKRRQRRRDQESSPPETNNHEEIIYAKPNKVRKADKPESQSTELDLQRLNKDPPSKSASEEGSEQSNRLSNIVPILVTDTTLEIDDIIMETCLDESETVVTEANAITGKTKDDDTYYNVLSFQRNQIKVDKFEEYVKSKTTFDFYTEFQKFPKGLSRPYTYAKKSENKVKCRYNGVYPYDTNRVKLPDKDNDFINASYIDGYTRPKEYIACLGPTKVTMADFVDFWTMIWQDNVEKIVMLTKLVEETKMKCEQYWPDIGNIISYGDVIVTCQSEDVCKDYTTRMLSVKKGETTRLVYQTHFLSWPDKRVPERTDVLLTLIDNVRSPKSEMEGPIVVHCSAGVGRTGTYIALDILLQQLTEEGAVDVYGCVIGIRGQRVAMVQTLEQYEFIHNVLVESIRKTKSKF